MGPKGASGGGGSRQGFGKAQCGSLVSGGARKNTAKDKRVSVPKRTQWGQGVSVRTLCGRINAAGVKDGSLGSKGHGRGEREVNGEKIYGPKAARVLTTNLG